MNSIDIMIYLGTFTLARIEKTENVVQSTNCFIFFIYKSVVLSVLHSIFQVDWKAKSVQINISKCCHKQRQ